VCTSAATKTAWTLQGLNFVRRITDLFLGLGKFPPESHGRKEIAEYVAQHRALKWEDEVQHLINSGEVSLADLQSVDMRPSMLARFEEQSGAHGINASTTN
jgi:hypothetical protein